MADKIYFGVPGNIQVIPYPESGMGFDNAVDAEVTALVSGGRSVYRPSTAFKTLKLNWKGSTVGLAPVIDMYNGQFGQGPFYLNDPTMTQNNILPARWANSWQLAYQCNGWCKPVVNSVTAPTGSPAVTIPNTNRSVTFTQATAGTVATSGVLKMRTVRVPGKAYWLAAKGTATGGAGIKLRGFRSDTNVWEDISTFTTFTGVSTSILTTANTTYEMLEFDFYMPLGSTMTISGMALSTVDLSTVTPVDWMPRGQGVGALQFTDAAQGTLISTAVDRIGLSLTLTEVQQVESSIL